MSEENRCPQCGAVLPAHVPQGICPGCLLKRGLESQTAASQEGSGPAEGQYVPPTPAELAAYFLDLEILELVGRGGMGVVYKARQKRLDRLVALKILAPKIGQEPAFAERFGREARAMAMLSHPHVVAVHDFGQTDGLYYFLMEFVDGLNLRQLLDTGKLAPEEALAIVPQICEALQYAHDMGVVHRDIKPENILLDKRGRVKIADFGIAKLVGKEAKDLMLTGEGQIMGTLQYMAPEQIEHPLQVDHRADIYSLGVVFYQMLTGELPIGRFAPPSKKVQIDVRLDEVVLRALEKEPEHRYQQASEIKTCVESIVTTPGGLGAATGEANRQGEWRTFLGIPVTERPNGIPQIVSWPGLGKAFFVLLMCGLAAILVKLAFQGITLTEGIVAAGLAATVIAIGCGWIALKGFGSTREARRINRAMADANPLPVLDFWQVLEAGDYSQAWEKAAPYFQRDIGKDDWVNLMEKVRRPLGKAVARRQQSIQFINPGRRFTQTVITGFDSQQWATETSTAALQADGEWRVEKYDISPPAPGEPPPRSSDDAVKDARRQVKGPAIGLLVVGILNWVVLTLVSVLLGYIFSRHGDSPSPIHYIVIPAAFAVGIVLILGAFKMKQLEAYGLAVVASILAIIISPANLIGLPIGIWALVVLSRRDVRNAFRQNQRKEDGRSWKRWTAISAIVLVVVAIWLTISNGNRGYNPSDVQGLSDAELLQRLPRQVEEPWVWRELEKRLGSRSLTKKEVNEAVEILIAHMTTKRPNGWDQPLTWFDGFLSNATKAGMVSSPVLLELCDAVYGPKPTIDLPRWREDKPNMPITINYGSTWDATNQYVLGVALLWQIEQFLLDGKPIKVQGNRPFDSYWAGNTSVRTFL